MKDLNETLYQYSDPDKKGVTQAFDLLQEKVCYYHLMLNLKQYSVTPSSESM